MKVWYMVISFWKRGTWRFGIHWLFRNLRNNPIVRKNVVHVGFCKPQICQCFMFLYVAMLCCYNSVLIVWLGFGKKKHQKHLVRVRKRPIFWLNKTVLVAKNMLWCSEVSSQSPPFVAGNWCHTYKSWNTVWDRCHRLGNVYCHHFIQAVGYEGCIHSCFYD